MLTSHSGFSTHYAVCAYVLECIVTAVSELNFLCNSGFLSGDLVPPMDPFVYHGV